MRAVTGWEGVYIAQFYSGLGLSVHVFGSMLVDTSVGHHSMSVFVIFSNVQVVEIGVDEILQMRSRCFVEDSPCGWSARGTEVVL